jgi:DNA-binding winged helix-turn-helix (wHTH) protein
MARNGRSVDVCIHKLRRKLELAAPGWRYIHTHYGVGYRLEAKLIDAPPSEISRERKRLLDDDLAADEESSVDGAAASTQLAA